MTRKRFRLSINVVLVCLALPALAFAATATSGGGAHSFDVVLISLCIMLVVGKLGGELFERLRQPAVLGELIGGIIIGNLILFGVTAAEPLKTDAIIAAIAEIGVIILLFEVGLQSDLHEMLEVGWSSLLVALLGVVAPFILGWVASAYFLPDASRLVHIFIGATLCATSVGITARVFKDMAKLNTREARIILGAAVVDDVIGLVILAVVVGAIKAAATDAVVSLVDIAWIAAKAIGFLLISIVLGQFLVPRLLRGASRFETTGVLLTLSISFCLFLSWAASRAGLAPIVGAFAAGLVLDEVHYTAARGRKERNLESLLQPVSTFVVPIFFVLMGLKVDLRTLARIDIIWFALGLSVIAIIGKQICSLGVVERGVNRIAVGIGMIPRGEVGLIFAGIGSALTLPNGSGGTTQVINQATFSAVVIMVLLTTLITPPALKWSMGRSSRPGTSRKVED
jgi:Kef-type K+ transport system membrane component KefB